MTRPPGRPGESLASPGRRLVPGWPARTIARLRTAPYVGKWVILGAIIGIIAGLGAVVFFALLHLATLFLLGSIGGYHPPTPAGEGNSLGSFGFARPWAIPLVAALAGLVSGIIVFRLAPEAEGHGTDAAIAAFHHNPRGIRRRVALIKMVASAITIGSGGSGGREGPTAQISAAFGSYLGRLLDLSPQDSRIAVSVGIGSGIGAIFRAPLGGAVLGAEILYRDDFEVEALIPSVVASIVAFAIFGAFNGFLPIFGLLQGYRFDQPLQLLWFALLGIIAGLMGRLYARVFYGVSALAVRLRAPRMLKPAAGGLLVGLLGLAIPGVLGTGYGWVQEAMGPRLMLLPLWLVLLLPLAKIVATSLSIGSGGSGGIFGPGMVIGGFTGAAAWRLLHGVAPGMPHDPAPFVVVGMIACFGSIAHAPLAVMLMVSEMTGSLALLPPAMVAVGLATLTVGDRTIYTSQLRSRADSPAHRFRFGMPALQSIPVEDAMTPPALVLDGTLPISEALSTLSAKRVPGAPVVADGRYVGVVQRSELDADGDTDASASVDSIARDDGRSVASTANLGDVMDAFATAGASWLPVLDGGTVVGIVSTGDLLRAYRKTLVGGLRRIEGLTGRAQLVEARVSEGSRAAAARVRDVPWPAGTLVVTVDHAGDLALADGGAELHAGDVVSAICPPSRVGAFFDLIGDSLSAPPASPGPELV